MDVLGWIGIPTLVVGIGLLIFGIVQGDAARRSAAAAASWPTVTGTVTDTRIDTRGTIGNPIYEAIVSYSYQVGDRDYAGARLRPGYNGVGSPAQAERMLQPYPIGSRVAVRYNPANPQETLLELHMSKLPMVWIAAGALIATAGLVLLILSFLGVLGSDSGSRSSREYDRTERSRDYEDYGDEARSEADAGEEPRERRVAEDDRGSTTPRPVTVPPNGQYLVGTWGPNCPASNSDSLTLNFDGTALGPNGRGTWTIDQGSTVTINLNGRTRTAFWEMQASSRQAIVRPVGGTPMRVNRC